MSSEYSRTCGVVSKRGRGKARGGVVNRRGQQKARVASPVMGRAVCPGREPDCLKPSGTGVGVSTCIYDLNSLGDRARQGRRSEHRHVGTVEGISARIHVAANNQKKSLIQVLCVQQKKNCPKNTQKKMFCISISFLGTRWRNCISSEISGDFAWV